MSNKCKRQHIIPATIISNFSKEKRADSRKNSLFVKFTKPNLIKYITADKLLKENHFYTIFKEGEEDYSIDDIWVTIERKFQYLYKTLDKISSDKSILNVEDLKLLIEFVTQFLVRGKAFTRHFDYIQKSHFDWEPTKERNNIN